MTSHQAPAGGAGTASSDAIRPHSTASDVATTGGPADRTIGGPLLVTLALLSAVSPFATDMYLPGLPDVSRDLHTSATVAQLTLTSFLAGVTVGQLVFGALSDRWGRRPLLLLGSALCVAASIVCVVATSVPLLVGVRLLQGFGGAAGMVIARAVISDLVTGAAAARAFSLMMMVSGIAPVVAPLAGGILMPLIGWRGVLGVVAGLAVVMLACVVVSVPETLPRERRRAGGQRMDPESVRELRSRGFVGYGLAFGFAFAVLMAYISASAFFYEDIVGLSTTWFGVAFGVTALLLMATSGLTARIMGARSPEFVLRWGLRAVVAATVVLLVLVLVGVPAVWLVPLIVLSVIGLGPALGTSTALSMSEVRTAGGTASALLGALQYGLGALVSPLVSMAGKTTVWPMAATMAACAVLAMSGSLLARRTLAA